MKFDETFKLGKPVETSLWMVDIVGYSKIRSAAAQEELIKNLFSCVYNSVDLVRSEILEHGSPTSRRELGSDDATVIWTGDGAILALKSPFDKYTPLKLTHHFLTQWNSESWTSYWEELDNGWSAPPKLHVATHVGQCRWLSTPTLRSPLFEVSNCFGVDINILARLSTFSTSNGEFVISEAHYKSLNPDEHGDVDFTIGKGVFRIGVTAMKNQRVTDKGDDEFQFRFFELT